MPNSDSPPDDVTFRQPGMPTPRFSGVNLPPVLRELRAQPIHRQSDMTALANRLRSIRIDRSPSGTPDVSPKNPDGATPKGVAPVKLDFSAADDHQDKENVPTPESSDGAVTPPGKRRPRSRPFGEALATAQVDGAVAVRDEKQSAPAEIAPALDGGDTDIPAEPPVALPPARETPEKNDGALKDALSLVRGESVATGEEGRKDEDIAMDFDLAEEAEQSVTPTSTDAKEEEVSEREVVSSDSGVTQANSTQEEDISHQLSVAEAAYKPPSSLRERVERLRRQSACFALAAARSNEDESAGAVSPITDHTVSTSRLRTSSPAPPLSNAPVSPGAKSTETGPAPSSPHHHNPQPLKTGNVSTLSVPDEARGTLAAKSSTSGAAPTGPEQISNVHSAASLETVSKHLEILSAGRYKRGWPERCEALNGLKAAIDEGLSEECTKLLNRALPALSSKVNDQLDELRPTVITAALKLFDSIISSDLNIDTFIENVFPSVMDVASGASLTATDAAGSLSLALDIRPELASALADTDDPKRMAEVLNEILARETLVGLGRTRAKNALRIVGEMHPSDVPPVETSPVAHHPSTPTMMTTLDVTKPLSSTVTPTATRPHAGPIAPSSRRMTHSPAPIAEPSRTEQQSPSIQRNIPETPNSSRVLSARLSSRLSWRAKLQTPGLISGQGFPGANQPNAESADSYIPAVPRSPVVSNEIPHAKVTNETPSSARNVRMYTEADLEEARNAAMRVCMEEASKSEANEREKLLKEKTDLEETLMRERTENKELQGVLTEFEMTMQKMVSQSNSKASMQQSALETEKNKLKGELVGVSESFEQLKEKYDTAKQTITLLEGKESRLIEQVKDLKANMVELQKWSNDLKANAEKKLAKSFEAVTSYRASYLDKEAYAQKALCDLDRTKGELEKIVTSHAETAAKVSHLENELHQQQDAKSEADGLLTATKASLSRVTGQRDRIQGELDEAHKELGETRAKVTELQGAASHARDAQRQIEMTTSENQSLKARAYDDMTRIRKLQSDLEEKDREVEELNTLCEEAMTQLEGAKLGG